jgi:hypothetical protein
MLGGKKLSISIAASEKPQYENGDIFRHGDLVFINAQGEAVRDTMGNVRDAVGKEKCQCGHNESAHEGFDPAQGIMGKPCFSASAKGEDCVYGTDKSRHCQRDDAGQGNATWENCGDGGGAVRDLAANTTGNASESFVKSRLYILAADRLWLKTKDKNFTNPAKEMISHLEKAIDLLERAAGICPMCRVNTVIPDGKLCETCKKSSDRRK